MVFIVFYIVVWGKRLAWDGGRWEEHHLYLERGRSKRVQVGGWEAKWYLYQMCASLQIPESEVGGSVCKQNYFLDELQGMGSCFVKLPRNYFLFSICWHQPWALSKVNILYLFEWHLWRMWTALQALSFPSNADNWQMELCLFCFINGKSGKNKATQGSLIYI